ncbi:MAG: hypothetical protein KUG73_10690 [Pseudomonadales bacterium]|nr:hypothetical protein [Pseudomonadales bacterium]
MDFDTAKKRVENARKEQKEKDLEKRFKKAIGWKEKSKFKVKAKVKKSPGANGPKPKKTSGKSQNKPSKPRGKGK